MSAAGEGLHVLERDHLLLTGAIVVTAISSGGLVAFAAYLLLSSERVRRETLAAITSFEDYIKRCEALIEESRKENGQDR